LFVPLILLLSASAAWFVWASLDASWDVPLYLQYGDGIPPYAYTQLPALIPQQRYHVSLVLVLPYTDSNAQLGNFMTSLTVSTLNNKTVAHVRRPAITLPPKASFLFSSPISSHLRVPLLESFAAGKSNLAASVEIGRRDAWTSLGAGQGREVNIIAASLRGLVVPHGIRGVAIRFPLLSSLACAGTFLLILSLIVGMCILPLLLPNLPEGAEEAEIKEEPRPTDSLASGWQSLSDRGKRRRSSMPRRSSGETIGVKQEISSEAPVQTLSASTDPTKGLRRRSSKPTIPASEEEI
jgi:hypothetical protein